MDNSEFSLQFWDSNDEGQRQQFQRFTSAPTAGAFPAFGFPATLPVDPVGFGHPAVLLPPDLFPGTLQPASQPHFQAPGPWDVASSCLPQSQQPDGTIPQWDDPSAQPHWDDFISSLPPPPVRPPSTGSSEVSFYNDDYGIDLLMGEFGAEFSSSRFSSAPPSSIPEDDGWSSRGWSSGSSRPVSAAPSSVHDNVGENSPPSISVEIQPWDSANCSDDAFSGSFPVPEPAIDPVDEAPDMDARLGWEWKPSGVKWLDPEVSSEVVEFPRGMKLTDKSLIYALHRVKGCPSQFPFYSSRTAFLVDFTSMEGLEPNMTVDISFLWLF
ncbi:hypothetical protein B0H12DRAFT_135817 [Mycena haematopus]|nr:hypothetical protein B0H12DRAFT_135817 [Mycena haematopus]